MTVTVELWCYYGDRNEKERISLIHCYDYRKQCIYTNTLHKNIQHK